MSDDCVDRVSDLPFFLRPPSALVARLVVRVLVFSLGMVAVEVETWCSTEARDARSVMIDGERAGDHEKRVRCDARAFVDVCDVKCWLK